MAPSEEVGSHPAQYTRKLWGEGYAADVYDDRYAERYDQLWQENPDWSGEVDNYLESFRQVLTPETRWLDAGCGTGWFLSKFPGIPRAGMDIAPAMLRQAAKANPDALFFREADFRSDVPEWHDSWDLISATGQGWGYVDHLSEIATIIDNWARWLTPTGTLFIQAADLADLTGLERAQYYDIEAPPTDPIAITGVIWSIRDAAGLHPNQIWPSFDLWIRWLRKRFRRIEVVVWPHDPEFLPVPRRLILASAKRLPGDDGPTEIIHRHLHEREAVPGALPGPITVPLDGVPTDAEVPGDDAASESHPLPGPGQPIPGRRLVDQPLSYLIGRVRPTEAAFWSSAWRRVRRRLR